ncbi:hypothetical protein ANN_08558 [Periplaneta americana]|uniref:Uncharacterized protein n=1 Tax=Periplaneta americana TaxID=6978 RepID=A0ABQ8T3E7_PERAM|nr:hypothetical protein ANN_08558 [Periplaneta americana]
MAGLCEGGNVPSGSLKAKVEKFKYLGVEKFKYLGATRQLRRNLSVGFPGTENAEILKIDSTLRCIFLAFLALQAHTLIYTHDMLQEYRKHDFSVIVPIHERDANWETSDWYEHPPDVTSGHRKASPIRQRKHTSNGSPIGHLRLAQECNHETNTE